jgi:mRNA interferase RelE/StbE
MVYRVEVKKSARKEITALPKRDQRRVVTAIAELASNPRPLGARRLTAIENAYRVRVGDYRVVYQVADDVLIVYVVRVAHRKDVYRRL